MLLEYAINKAGSFDTEAIRTALENAQGVKLFSDDNFTVDKETHNPLNKTVSVLKITDGQYTLYKNISQKANVILLSLTKFLIFA